MLEPARSAPRNPLRQRRRRVRSVAILPTLITLGNAICGFYAAISVARGMGLPADSLLATAEFHKAAYLILIAMIFDALDGKVARITRTASNFGTQLDSLCDFFTFGVVPAFLTYGLTHQGPFGPQVTFVVCAFYMCLAATRLARFNVETGTDEKFHREFTGLPSPAAAGVIATIVIPWGQRIEDKWIVTDALNWGLHYSLPIIAFVVGVLMVSRIGYPHFLNKMMRGPRPFVSFVEVTVILLLVVIFHQFALFLGFMGYAIMGPILWARSRIFKRAPARPRPVTPEPPAGNPLF